MTISAPRRMPLLASSLLLATQLAMTAGCASAADQPAAWEVPADLSGKLSALDSEARRFVSSGDFIAYMPPRQMEIELETRNAEGLAELVAGLMSVAEMMGYDPERDMGAMPLNTSSTSFNEDVLLPPVLRDDKRDPGPFSVHRYLYPTSGVPTFAGAPVAIWPEDLTAGQVDIAIIGVPNDMGSGRRNAEAGPRAMRSLDTIATPDIQTLVDPMAELTIVDYGDFRIDNMSTERTIDHVTAMVAETAATGAVPMMVGGDTSMLYPGVKGIAETLGMGSFGLVHFSAHPDADRDSVHTISDDQALFMLIDEGIVEGGDLITVGLRGPAVTADILQWLRDEGVRYHTMAEIGSSGYESVMSRVLDEIDALPEKLFVSIDVSVIEPGDMIAAGRIAANGLDLKQVAGTIRHLCAAREIVGFEITDMAPMLDFSRLSAVNANAVLNACLTGIAARHAGFAADEIHPLSLDHGQD